MNRSTDILILGSGVFAARQTLDIAATARQPVRVTIAGRNSERVLWLTTAARARSCIYGTPVSVSAEQLDLDDSDALTGLIAQLQPRVVVQSASAQGSAVIGAKANAWTQLVSEAGYSATAVFQALLAVRAARAVRASAVPTAYINCSYPDVVNPMIAALGLPILCGVGNVAILAAVFASVTPRMQAGKLKVLGPYQTIRPFREALHLRSGPAPRVWRDDQEIQDVLEHFAVVKLTPEPVIEISGATGVPLMLAVAAGTEWIGHAPGPQGLPGGYPVKVAAGVIELDLPSELSKSEATTWNLAFERQSGVVTEEGHVFYTGNVQAKLSAVSPEIAKGFALHDLEDAYRAMNDLRRRLQDS